MTPYSLTFLQGSHTSFLSQLSMVKFVIGNMAILQFLVTYWLIIDWSGQREFFRETGAPEPLLNQIYPVYD